MDQDRVRQKKCNVGKLKKLHFLPMKIDELPRNLRAFHRPASVAEAEKPRF